MNPFQIVENSDSPKIKWLTYAPNNSKNYYGALVPFETLFPKPTLNLGTVIPFVWVDYLLPKDNSTYPPLSTRSAVASKDISRNPTIEEYVKIAYFLKHTKCKYNKKTKQLVKC